MSHRARRPDCDPPTDTAYAPRARMLDCESASMLLLHSTGESPCGYPRPCGASHIMLGAGRDASKMGPGSFETPFVRE